MHLKTQHKVDAQAKAGVEPLRFFARASGWCWGTLASVNVHRPVDDDFTTTGTGAYHITVVFAHAATM